MNTTWLITSALANQRARKALFTCVVYTKVSYDLLLFMLKIETTTRGTNSMPFLVFQRDHARDHLRSNLGIISGLGIICGRGSFAALYRSIWECVYENVCRGSEVLQVFKDRRHFWFPVCNRRKLYLSCPFSEETATSIAVRVLSSSSQRSHVTSCS